MKINKVDSDRGSAQVQETTDYFAAAFLNGFVASFSGEEGMPDARVMSSMAYNYAAGMMAERAKRNCDGTPLK